MRAGAKLDLDLYRGIAARVEDLPRVHRLDLAHRPGRLAGAQSRLRVVGELLLGRERVPLPAVGAGKLLGTLHALAEALGRRAQRELRVDLQLPRDVDGGEQHIADLVELLLAIGRLLELLQLPGDGVVWEVMKVEPGRRRPPLHLAGVQRPRQVPRHLAEDAWLPPLL